MLGRWAAVIFNTSAPCSARVRAHVGPARTRVRSSTRMPDNGRSPSGSFPGALGRDDRLLQLERIPLGHRLAYQLAIFGHTEHAQGSGTMVREIAVEIAAATVLGRIDPHHRVALGGHVRPVHLHVVPAAEGGGRLARIDGNALA